jgi:hypothetical protein
VQEEPPPSRPKESPAAVQVCGEHNQASSSYFRNDFCEQKTRVFFIKASQACVAEEEWSKQNGFFFGRAQDNDPRTRAAKKTLGKRKVG